MGGGILDIKSKNAFTLIELLAIIVILAIIAVITVPIILNIIENSRMGAATDSAYGYKDAVNKWYVTKLQEDNQFQLADSYTISSDGKLGDIVIPISGDKPSGGYLNYSNNTLTGGCLVIGDYAVTFEGGNATSTIKGTCTSSSNNSGNGQGNNGNEPVFTSFTGKVLNEGSYFENLESLPTNAEFWIQRNDTIDQGCIFDFNNNKTICVDDRHYDCGTFSINSSGKLICSTNGYTSNKLNEIQEMGFTCSIYEDRIIQCFSSDDVRSINIYAHENGRIVVDNLDGWACNIDNDKVLCN